MIFKGLSVARNCLRPQKDWTRGREFQTFCLVFWCFQRDQIGTLGSKGLRENKNWVECFKSSITGLNYKTALIFQISYGSFFVTLSFLELFLVFIWVTVRYLQYRKYLCKFEERLIAPLQFFSLLNNDPRKL